mgnify:CR=1 FL=1|jgi:hypothetical protein
MVIYNVTVSIDDDVHQDWLQWMQEVHIPEVMATGFFLESRMSKILGYEEGGISYSIQYLCENHDVLERYQLEQAPRLQAEHTSRFQGKFAAFRTLLDVCQIFENKD